MKLLKYLVLYPYYLMIWHFRYLMLFTSKAMLFYARFCLWYVKFFRLHTASQVNRKHFNKFYYKTSMVHHVIMESNAPRKADGTVRTVGSRTRLVRTNRRGIL